MMRPCDTCGDLWFELERFSVQMGDGRFANARRLRCGCGDTLEVRYATPPALISTLYEQMMDDPMSRASDLLIVDDLDPE